MNLMHRCLKLFNIVPQKAPKLSWEVSLLTKPHETKKPGFNEVVFILEKIQYGNRELLSPLAEHPYILHYRDRTSFPDSFRLCYLEESTDRNVFNLFVGENVADEKMPQSGVKTAFKYNRYSVKLPITIAGSVLRCGTPEKKVSFNIKIPKINRRGPVSLSCEISNNELSSYLGIELTRVCWFNQFGDGNYLVLRA